MVRLTIKPFSVVLLLFINQGCYTAGHSIFCKDSVRTKATSPNGRYVAETVESDCGATEHETVVRMRRVQGFFRDESDVFATSRETMFALHERVSAAISCPWSSGTPRLERSKGRWVIRYVLFCAERLIRPGRKSMRLNDQLSGLEAFMRVRYCSSCRWSVAIVLSRPYCLCASDRQVVLGRVN